MGKSVKKEKDYYLVLEWKITLPLKFVTLELIYFLNSDKDSGSNRVLESQAFAGTSL